jgi:phosphoglycerate dehydrogenase-like enzyme
VENVIITPHLAGSQGNEWGRLATLAIAEIGRWIAGEKFAYPVRRETLDRQA